MRNLTDRLFQPLDVAALVLFRILFGAIMAWEVWRYVDHGWIRRNYIDPDFHFTYFGFSWVRPLPGDWVYVHFLVVGVAGLFVALGLLYRLSAVVVFVGFTWWFLLEQARYLNHFYLVSLISFIMIFVPAHRTASLDALIWRKRRSDDAPAWALWLLRAQIGIVYFMAGVAKLNVDWLRGEPIRMWLAKRDDYTILGELLPVGRLFTEEWVVYLVAYGGLLLDLLVFPALLWRRTRALAFACAAGFHLANAWLFDIGIFPWFMLAATLLFFEPAWPRRLFNWPRGDALGRPSAFRAATSSPARALVTALLGAYVSVQVLVPLRHFLYPGTVHWTEEGHRFAWHMKLRDKSSRVRLRVIDETTGLNELIHPRRQLTSRQVRKMGSRPDMLLQYCHHLAERYRAEGHPNVRVYARVEASLNGRPSQLLVDPAVDLAAQPRNLLAASWIIPLKDEEGPTADDGDRPGRDEDGSSQDDD